MVQEPATRTELGPPSGRGAAALGHARLVALAADIEPLAVLAALLVTVALGAAAFTTVVVQDRLVNALCDLVVVVGLYTFVGNSGILSFGHVSFVAIGAYTSVLLTIPPETKHFVLPQLPPAVAGIHADFADFVPAAAVAAVVAAV